MAAAIMGLSWELAYHARWIATDSLMMQFGTLALMFIFLGMVKQRPEKWLKFSAIAVGFAAGTKYTGAALFLPIFAAVLLLENKSITHKIFLILKLAVFSFVTFVITTPAILIDPIRLFVALQNEAVHYRTGHDCYTVNAGFEHLSLIVNYFVFVVCSKYPVIAVFFFLTALTGFVVLLREKDWKSSFIFLCYPVFHVTLMSFQKVMFVRNLQILIPFFAILSARGCIYIFNLLHLRMLRILFVVLLTVVLTINAGWLVYASELLIHRRAISQVFNLSHFIDGHPKENFVLSRRLASDLNIKSYKNRPNVVGAISLKAKYGAFYADEVVDDRLWTANRFNYAVKWFGSPSVNYNYYPTWPEKELIIVLSIQKAKRLHVLPEY